MRKLLNVMGKELTELRRDRRSLTASFAYALFGPLVVGLVIHLLWAEASKKPDLTLAIESPQPVPALEQYLQSRGFALDEAATLRLRLSASFAQDLAAGERASLTISGRLRTQELSVRALRDALNGFSELIAEQRLIGRGIVPSAVKPLIIETEDASSFDRRAESVLTMLLLFFILAPFFSSMSHLIDCTAGERERFSIEALLTRPVAPAVLIGGKWLSGAVIGVLGTAATAIAGKAVLEVTPLRELGIGLSFEWQAVLAIVLLLLPLTLLVAAAQLAIALAARSYKEGQSYLTLLSFAPAVIGFMAQSNSALKDLPVPIFFEMQALNGMLGGGDMNLPLLLMVVACYALAATALLLMSTRLLAQPRLLEAS